MSGAQRLHARNSSSTTLTGTDTMQSPLSLARIASTATVLVVHVAMAFALTLPGVPTAEHEGVQEIVEALVDVRAVSHSTQLPRAPQPLVPPARPEPAREEARSPIGTPAPPNTTLDAAAPQAETSLPIGEIHLLVDHVPDFSVPMPDVPAAELPGRESIEGDALKVRVLVDKEGIPAAVIVAQTNADPARIEAALQELRSKRFHPALLAGRAINAWLDLTLPL